MVEAFSSNTGHKWLVLKPNQSLTTEQFLRFLCTTFGISLTVITTCFYWGVWAVVPFATLEFLGLGCAFLWVRWQQGYREVLTISDDIISLESGIGRPTFEWCSIAKGFRVLVKYSHSGRQLTLYACNFDSVLEIGRCLNCREKKLLVDQFRTLGVRIQYSGPPACVEF